MLCFNILIDSLLEMTIRDDLSTINVVSTTQIHARLCHLWVGCGLCLREGRGWRCHLGHLALYPRALNYLQGINGSCLCYPKIFNGDRRWIGRCGYVHHEHYVAQIFSKQSSQILTYFCWFVVLCYKLQVLPPYLRFPRMDGYHSVDDR